MKKVIRLTEDDLTRIVKRVIEESEMQEGILSTILRAVKGIPKAVSSVTPRLINKTTLKSLNDELLRLIPKKDLSNQKEVSSLVRRLHDLGPDVNTLKVNHIKKFGQKEYDSLVRKYLYGAMDKKTFLSKLKSVKNVNIKIKPVLGQGADHRVFESLTHPDKIFKLELRPGEIDKWYNTFISHPEIFPKVFKKIKVKTVNGEILTSALMERLNINEFMKLWDEMENLMHRSQKGLPHSEQVGTLEYLVKNFKKNSKHTEQWNNFINYSKTVGGTSSKKIDEFIKMVNNLYKLTPNPDIRKFNFGYDTKGMLKSLDL